LTSRVADLQLKSQDAEGRQRELTKEAASLQHRIDALKQKLNTSLVPAHAAAADRYRALKEESARIAGRMDALFNKQVCAVSLHLPSLLLSSLL
jgi:FtsZ-binding cell division protein ZapB